MNALLEGREALATPKAPPRTIIRTVRFGHDTLDTDDHRRAVLAMAHDLGAQLRDTSTVARTVALSVWFADRSSTSRSCTLPETTDHTRALTTAADTVLGTLALQRARVRAISMTLELGDPAAAAHQLNFDPADKRQRRLEAATDRARRRFGPTAIGPAALYRAA